MIVSGLPLILTATKSPGSGKTEGSITNTSLTLISGIILSSVIFKANASSELQLVRLYQMILEIHAQEKQFKKYLPLPKGFRQLSASME
ncbi:hypothetical protein Ltuc_0415 [Legionella tucsonensis]|uniref:Uncharacterized protein n=1 Tax=Legionella tucsonensis TaxID=40335 RepID=A0A0W0ZU41_9GAMM|nr:hypothetical protein Ltuc_0415 [Legionella tucsonensis]